MIEKKSKLLYIMHTPWGWIKQRPQFIAEGLIKYYKIDVIEGIPHFKYQRPDSLKFFPYLPLVSNSIINKLFKKINSCLYRVYLIFAPLLGYKYIWITSIEYYKYLRLAKYTKAIIIFDLMDNILEFDSIKQNLKLYKELQTKSEPQLLQDANLILCSSAYLQKYILKKSTELIHKTSVIYNALDYGFLCARKVPENYLQEFIKLREKDKKILLYIGTIENWIDFKLLEDSLCVGDDFVYVFIGPKLSYYEGNSRMIFLPPIEHKFVYSLLVLADILIMPFIVNELIRAVDPVKIYEYICVNKFILLPFYEEVSKFAKVTDKIHFYYDSQSYIDKLKFLVTNSCLALGKELDIQNFVKCNCWQYRCEQIQQILRNK